MTTSQHRRKRMIAALFIPLFLVMTGIYGAKLQKELDKPKKEAASVSSEYLLESLRK